MSEIEQAAANVNGEANLPPIDNSQAQSPEELQSQLIANMQAKWGPLRESGEDEKPQSNAQGEALKEASTDAADEDSNDDFLSLFDDDKSAKTSGEVELLTSQLALNELASKINVSEEDLLKKLLIKTKVNGEEEPVTLEQLIKERQLERHTQKRSQEIAHREKEIEALKQDYQVKVDNLKQSLHVVSNLALRAEKKLDDEYKAVNWNHLKEEDPTLFAMKRVEFMEKRQALQDEVREIYQTFEAQNKHAYEEKVKEEARLKREVDEWKQSQYGQLLKTIPELKDQKKAPIIANVIQRELLAAGFSKDEIDSSLHFYDHRVYPIILAAGKYRALSEKSKVTEKKASQPLQSVKTVKPQPRKESEDVKHKAVDMAFEQAKQTRNQRDMIKALIMKHGSVIRGNLK
jgi:hypothetical protein